MNPARLLGISERSLPWRSRRRRFTTTFLITLACTALAKGAALLPGYSIDDYFAFQRQPTYAQLLRAKGANGRFGTVALSWLLELLGLEPPQARILFVCLAIGLTALLATLIVRYWNRDRDVAQAAALGCIIANHPFTVEIFTFRMALNVLVFPLAILCLLLLPHRWSKRGFITAAALFVLALSFYQVVLQVVFEIVVVGAAIWLTRQLVLDRRFATAEPPPSHHLPRRWARYRDLGLAASVAAGTAFYALTLVVLTRLTAVPLGARAQILAPGQAVERLREALHELFARLLLPQALLTRTAQALLLFILAGAVVGLARQCWGPRPASRVPKALAVLGLLGLALLGSLGFLLVLREFWPTPRILAQIGIFWAGALAIAHECHGRRARAVLRATAWLAVVSFVASNNHALADQRRLNVRDTAQAQRIVARLEALPGFTGLERVAIDGATWTHIQRLPTTDHDLNVSAFAAPHSNVAILAEVSGYGFVRAPDPSDVAAAAAYCAGKRPWPGPQAVALVDQLAIVCLGRDGG